MKKEENQEIGLQHLILEENRSSQRNLTISVSTNFISLSVSDFSTDNLIDFKKKIFENPLSVENITDELKTILDNSNLENENFNKIKLIQENDLFVFVPDELYSSKEKKNYLKFNTKIQENDYLSVDDIDKLKIKNVYIPYINVNNLLVDKFKNIEYYHFNTELLKKIDEIRVNEQYFVHIEKGKIKIVVFKKDELKFFNSFEIENNSDIVYYILLTLKEQKLELEKTKINYIIDFNYDELNEFSNNFFDNHKILNKKFKTDFLHC